MTPTSSNEAESQSASPNAILSIDDEESKLPESKEALTLFTFETSKQYKRKLLYIKRRSSTKSRKMTERKLKHKMQTWKN